MPYKVGNAAGVGARMHLLAQRASLAGIRQAYLDALTMMLQRLSSDPLVFGDPLYRMPHQGGIVCHAVVGPILVHYSVHEAENSVIVGDIKPLYEWPIRP